MKRYFNTKTGAVLETDCLISGDDWVCECTDNTEETTTDNTDKAKSQKSKAKNKK